MGVVGGWCFVEGGVFVLYKCGDEVGVCLRAVGGGVFVVYHSGGVDKGMGDREHAVTQVGCGSRLVLSCMFLQGSVISACLHMHKASTQQQPPQGSSPAVLATSCRQDLPQT